MTISDSKVNSAFIELDDINMLVLISDGCGWNYFDVNETLVEMGVNVITIANTESHTVTSCLNREPRPITADILLSEFDLETINEYDGIVIPSGGQWAHLAGESDVNELLDTAYDNGLVVGAICIGVVTLARSDIITNGTKVASPVGYAYRPMRDTGADMISSADVVSDRRIITGGAGGGPPTGYESAPTYELCLEMVKEITGQSYAEKISVIPNNETGALDYMINVEIANLSLEYPEFEIAHVQQVTAIIYPEANSTDTTEVELTYLPGTSQYIGNYTSSNLGKQVIDLDIMNSEWSLEVVRNAITFNVEEPEEPEPGEDDPLPLTLLVIGGAGAVVIVVLLVFWKRRS